MRWLLTTRTAALVALSGTLGSCSGTPSAERTSDGGSSAGGLGTGGARGTGGTHGTGGDKGAGGALAPPPPECGVDAGADACRLCLARNCCADAMSCFGDATCTAAFSTKQSCDALPGQVDPARCFSEFARAVTRDGGANAGIATCITFHCSTACGGPSPL